MQSKLFHSSQICLQHKASGENKTLKFFLRTPADVKGRCAPVFIVLCASDLQPAPQISSSESFVLTHFGEMSVLFRYLQQ